MDRVVHNAEPGRPLLQLAAAGLEPEPGEKDLAARWSRGTPAVVEMG